MIETVKNSEDVVYCIKCRKGFEKAKSFYGHYSMVHILKYDKNFIEKQKQARVITSKKLWENLEYRNKMSKVLRDRWDNPEFRKKMSELQNSKEYVKKNRERTKKRFENPEFKEKMKQVSIRTFTSEKFKKEQSIRSKNQWTDEFRKKRSEQVKEQWKDEKFRKINTDRINSLWSNPVKAAEMLRNSRIATGCKLNDCERRIETILNEMYPGLWEFVGDGTKVIYRYCPDFINEKDKLILEFFGGYWHNRTGEKERDAKRIEVFSRYGYETIVIWENELKDIEAVKNKIRNFCENRNEIEAIAV